METIQTMKLNKIEPRISITPMMEIPSRCLICDGELDNKDRSNIKSGAYICTGCASAIHNYKIINAHNHGGWRNKTLYNKAITKRGWLI